MDISVAFTTQLKAAIGEQEQSLTLEAEATVRDAIDSLAILYPDQFHQLVLSDDGQLVPSILLSVNDQQVDVSARLCDGDTLTLLSAISGG